jgi:hypothetical protein
MAKQAVCDVCGRTETLSTYGLTPGGWVELQEHSAGPNPAPVLCCGWACVETRGKQEQAAAAAVAAAAEMRGGLRVVPPLADLGEPEPAPVVPAGWRPAEAGHVAAAQADSSDEGGGYVAPGE